ncbi:P83/100 family protein [Treponema sp.]|uniref:P83/100 family protein n=1 Tax=Treponema sp. TaxID=166 RepID=UPI0038911125
MNSQKVLKKTLTIILAIFAAASISALEVDRNEIQSTGGADTVVFRNYSGPHSVINTIAEIRQIGSSLGEQVNGNLQKSGTFGSSNRYSVIHAVDLNTKEKLDADILIIGKNATVDHITNLRRIISAYLSAAYGYSNRDADTIATFVTVYNAVYRGQIDTYNSKYKDVVTKNLSASIVGLSTDYREWPGKSQIVIPLSDLAGGLSTVDTSLISDKQVIKSMQGEDDKGVDSRKGMVDIKEREADNEQEKADSAQKKADDEKAKLAEEQKKSAQANKNAASAQKKADEANKNAASAQKKADEANKKAQENPDDKKAQSDASKAQKEADSAKKEADSAQKEADEQNKKTESQSQTASSAQKSADEAQAKADQKRSEAQEERTSIAKDQQSLIKESSQNADGNVIYGLKVLDDAGVTSELVKMDSQTGTVLKESPVTVIRGRTAFDAGDSFIAIAGTNFGNGAVRLVAIDKKNLEIAIESAEKLSEVSVLVEKEGSYFCTIQEGSDYYIGKYNDKVENQLKSQVKVKASTPITITAKGILVTDSNGQAIVLNPQDLSSISPASAQDNRNALQRAADSASNVYSNAK